MTSGACWVVMLERLGRGEWDLDAGMNDLGGRAILNDDRTQGSCVRVSSQVEWRMKSITRGRESSWGLVGSLMRMLTAVRKKAGSYRPWARDFWEWGREANNLVDGNNKDKWSRQTESPRSRRILQDDRRVKASGTGEQGKHLISDLKGSSLILE